MKLNDMEHAFKRYRHVCPNAVVPTRERGGHVILGYLTTTHDDDDDVDDGDVVQTGCGVAPASARCGSRTALLQQCCSVPASCPQVDGGRCCSSDRRPTSHNIIALRRVGCDSFAVAILSPSARIGQLSTLPSCPIQLLGNLRQSVAIIRLRS